MSLVTSSGSRLQAEIERCSRCGKCRSVCPVFAESLNEGMVARGRVELMRALLGGGLRPTRQVVRYLNACVKCLRCASVCPSGVEFGRIVEAARHAVSREAPLPLLARLGIEVLTPHRRLFDLVVRAAGLLQRLLPPGEGLPLRHLPMMLYGLRRLPKLAGRPILRRYPRAVGPEDGRMTVAFFVGCLQNYVFTEAAEAAVDLLVRSGFRVVVPGGQVCCGTPALSVGDLRIARRLARRNLAVFDAAGADAVVLACATCGSALKQEYPRLLGERGERWAARTYDLAEFLARFADPKALGFGSSDGASPVSYHDPCHLRWVQGVYEAPRRLLRRSGPYEELADADRCCGLGGVFSLFYPELSEAIARRKLPGLRELSAETVATECPGCRLQLEALFAKEGVAVRVKMLAEVLRDRLRPASEGDKEAARSE